LPLAQPFTDNTEHAFCSVKRRSIKTTWYKKMKLSICLRPLCVLGLVLSACGEDAEGGGLAALTTSRLVWVDGVDPAAGALVLEVAITNSGDNEATQLGLTLPQASAAGEFALVEPVPNTLGAGASWTARVRFTPAAGAPTGCALAVLGQAQVTYLAAPGKPRAVSVTLFVGGQCAQALRCAPQTVVVPSTVLGERSEQALVCLNAGAQVVQVQAMRLTDSLGGQLTLVASGLPRALKQGELVEATLAFAPTTRGQYMSAIKVEGDVPLEIAVQVEGRRIRPLCTDPAPTPPALPAEIDRYTFKLESGQTVGYEGQVASLSSVSEQYAPMIKSAILLATGSYLNEFCKISHSGAT
jgi:hypothetical protein